MRKDQAWINQAGSKSKQSRSKFFFIAATALIVFTAIVFTLIYPLGLDMQLNGESELTVEVLSIYEDLGCAVTYRGNDVSDQITIEGDVDTSTVGSYEVTYLFKAEHKLTKTVTRTVHIVDTQAPVITLNGSESILVPIGTEYKEYGCTAVDSYDGDLSDQITISDTIDIETVGVYEVTYSVSDVSGNMASIVRTVEVSDYDPLRASLADFSLDGFFPETILSETKDGGMAYIEGTIFVGDSIIGNMGYFDLIPIENVWTRSSLTPENIWSLKMNVYDGPTHGTFLDNISAYKPARIILTIGVSGSSWMSHEYFILKYTQLIDEIQSRSPNTQIIIGSILPIDKSYDDGDDQGFSNKKINNLNYYIAQMCEEKGVKFLNMAVAMKDKNGQAKAGYTYDSDGIHPKTVAYEAIIKYIRTHMCEE